MNGQIDVLRLKILNKSNKNGNIKKIMNQFCKNKTIFIGYFLSLWEKNILMYKYINKKIIVLLKKNNEPVPQKTKQYLQ